MKILLLVTLLPFLLTVNANNKEILQCRRNIFGDDIEALYINIEQSEMPRQKMIHQFCEKVDEYQKCVAEEEKEQITIELMQGMCEYGFEAVYKNITCLSKVITELKSTCISKRDACAISEEWFQCSLMVTQNICGEYLGYVMADLQQLYCQIFQVMTAEEPLEYDLIYAEDESEQTVDQFSIKNPIETTRRLSTKKSIKSTTPHKTNSPIITKRPHSTKKSGTTKQPHSTKKPGTTKQPHSTKKPGTTKRPHSTKKPGTTKQPHSTKKPGTTKRPHSTKKPGTTKRPHSTKKPSTTKRPHSTKMPSTTKRLATTTGQVTTTNSGINHLSSNVCYVISFVAATYLTKIF